LFKFAHTYYFYLFLLVPALTALFIWYLLWRRNALSRFGEWAIVRQLLPEASVPKLVLKFALAMLAAAFLVLTLAGPQTGSRIEKAHRKGIDLMIALDVSNSMLAEDIKPNRLERSKQSILRLIDQLDGDRIGIIVFAGKAYTQLPITTDYAAAKLFVSAISTDIIPTQGTAIGDAITRAIASYGDTKNNKAIIIITDGEDHQGDVLEQAETAAKAGILIYTIGMGLPDGAPIPVYNGKVMTGYKKDGSGNIIVSRLDEALLQQIATAGKGIYVRASNSEAGLRPIMEEIGKIQETEIESRQFTDYESRFQYFLAFAILLLVLDLFIFEKKTKWLKNFRPFS
jgi:Ca-activated chloride channel family protein